MINLGRLKLKNPFMFAPIALYSDIVYRRLCMDYGASHTFTEQIFTATFVRKSKRVLPKFNFSDKVGLQFQTNDPSELKEALRIVKANEYYSGLKNIKSIDLNIGCPDKDLIKRGLGAGLLKQPELVRELFKTLKKNTYLPVSVKIRLGLNEKHKAAKPYLKIAKIAKDEGLDFITVHARTAVQMYSGNIDMSAIKEIQKKVDIALVGNGNIIDEKSAEVMLKYCNAIMIGRHALKNPFIFKQLIHYLKTGNKWEFDIREEKKKCIEKYFSYADKYTISVQNLKVHIQALLKGIKGNSVILNKISRTRKKEEIKQIVLLFLQ